MAENAAAEQMVMPKHGQFCWNELATNNLEACKTFYGELFGWQFNTSDATGMAYTEFSLDGQKQFGGLFQITEEMGEMPSRWGAYVAVDNVDAAAEKVTELGGTVCMPPTDIPNVGRFCMVNDPTGAILSLITLKQPN